MQQRPPAAGGATAPTCRVSRGTEGSTDPRGEGAEENRDRLDRRSDRILVPSVQVSGFFLVTCCDLCRSSQGSEGEAGTPGPKGSKVSFLLLFNSLPAFPSEFFPRLFRFSRQGDSGDKGDSGGVGPRVSGSVGL